MLEYFIDERGCEIDNYIIISYKFYFYINCN
jgi:hypothetical protein